MKEFYCLMDGLEYCIKCPVCNTIISDGGRYHNYNYGSNELILPLSSNRSISHDNLIIDVYTGRTKINLEVTCDDDKLVAGIGNNIYQMSPQFDYTVYDGTLITSHSISCTDCCLYSYTLQLHVRVKECRLVKVLLNSENISIEEGDKLHEIRNNYSMDRTEYTLIEPLEYFHKTVSDRHKTLMLPLLYENLFNPTEILIRLKKLLVFS